MKRTRSDSAGEEPGIHKRAKESPGDANLASESGASEPPRSPAAPTDSVTSDGEASKSEPSVNSSQAVSSPGAQQDGMPVKSESKTLEPASPEAHPATAEVAEAPSTAPTQEGGSSTNHAAATSSNAEPAGATASSGKPDARNTQGSEKKTSDNAAERENQAISKSEDKSENKPEGKQEGKPAGKPATFSSFSGSSGFSGFSGSSSKFHSLAKSSGTNPWAEPSKKTETKPQTKPEDEKGKFRTASPEESSAGFERQQDLVTGEEDEETLYSAKVRLYAVNLDSEERNWKERGVGTMKLNSSRKDRSKKRLLMRAESVLRVSLNLPLVKNTQLSKGFHSSLHTEKFLRISSIEDGHAYQFALKLTSEAARDNLYEEIERALASV